MSIRLTESRLRQIIREEASNLSRRLREGADPTGGQMTAVIEITSDGLRVEFPQHIMMNPRSASWKASYESLFRSAQTPADFGKIQRRVGGGGDLLGKFGIDYVAIKKDGVVSDSVTMAASSREITAAAKGVKLRGGAQAPAAPATPTRPSLPPITDVKSFQRALQIFDPDAYDDVMSGDFETPGELLRLVKSAGKRMGVTPEVMQVIVTAIKDSF